MNDLNSTPAWSLGTLIWLPICLILVAGLLVTAGLLMRYRRRRVRDRAEALGLAITCWGVVAGLVIGTGFGMYPYSAQYHRWEPVSGTVTAKSSRLLGDGDSGTTQRFVVTLAGIGQRSCDDTRCADVKVGDRLGLSCKRAWQYAGTDGWDCNFVGLDAS